MHLVIGGGGDLISTSQFTCPILGVPINTGPCSSVVKPMVFIFLPILVD